MRVGKCDMHGDCSDMRPVLLDMLANMLFEKYLYRENTPSLCGNWHADCSRNRASISGFSIGVVSRSRTVCFSNYCLEQWNMDGKDSIDTKVRISRRRFAICQIALLPAIWPAMKLVQCMTDPAIGHLHPHDYTPETFPGGRSMVAVTALATTAILRGEDGSSNPTVVKGLKSLEGFVHEDGGIYTPRWRLENYETCLAMMCLAEVNADGRYDRILHNAESFIKTCQWDENKGKNRADAVYGGAGYGKQRRPDLANTAFLVDATKSCNSDSHNSAVEKAMVFVSRCQNIAAANSNDSNAYDGGFHYTNVLGEGGLTLSDHRRPSSCGVLTYSGLKSLLLAGVKRDDPRVKAALSWIRNNYDLTCNPGMGSAGLFHYYHILAKTLDLLGVDVIEDAAGVKHDWRSELCEELIRRQRSDGSWLNKNGCWMENDTTVATANALLTFSYCRQAWDKKSNDHATPATVKTRIT